MLIDDRIRLSYDDVLIVPRFSRIDSRTTGTSLETTLGKEVLDVPILAANMDTIAGSTMCNYLSSIGAMGILHRGGKDPTAQLKHWKSDWDPSLGKIVLSVGSTHKKMEKERVDELFSLFSEVMDQVVICVDLAHGDSENMLSTLKELRNRGYEGSLIAGSVCTPDACIRVSEAGASVARVGVGPGSACETRIKTGCGYPQLSAVFECVQSGVPVIADGGIRTPSDAAKALAAGAKAVMIGGMLRGTDLTPNWTGPGNDVEFRGMASNAAKTSSGIAAGYEEGVSFHLPGKEAGSTKGVIDGLCDGIRSSMSYVGASTLSDFTNKAQFIRVSHSVVHENGSHALEK